MNLWVCAALLRQVMNLTAQQIDMLPDAQRQQVIDLQRQLVSLHYILRPASNMIRACRRNAFKCVYIKKLKAD